MRFAATRVLPVTVFMLWSTMVPAATFNIAAGDVAGLIAAINTANTNGQADTINLAAQSTYTLTAIADTSFGPTGLPALLSDGGNALTINGNGATIVRDASAPLFRILLVDGADVTINELMIMNGFTDPASSFTDGGGIRVQSGALHVFTSTIANHNTASIDNGGFGGAIGVRPGASAEITNCTLSGNLANRGGGLSVEVDATATVLNSTITRNTASAFGNRGGGVRVNTGGSLTLTNTIVAGNSSDSGVGPDCAGTIISGGHNLFGNASGCSGLVASDIITNPLLGPLQDNGGPTLTHALLPGSPAIDAADDAAAPPTDQRLVVRPQGPHSDIGAFEAPVTPRTGAPALDRAGLGLLLLMLVAFATHSLRSHAAA